MSDDRDWIDDLYAEGRDEAPPAALDAVILTAARDNATRPWYRNIRTLTTLATAASFVLAAMVVYYAPDDASLTGPPSKEAPERRQAIDRAGDRAAGAADEADVPARPPAVKVAAPQAPAESTEAERLAGTSLEEAALPSAAAPEVADAMTDSGRSMLSATNAARRAEQTATSVGLTANKTAEPKAVLDDVLSTLTGRCGTAPGTAESRTLLQDALGWYLAVTTAETVTYYRCIDDTWQVIEEPVSETSEQQPDPEDDQ